MKMITVDLGRELTNVSDLWDHRLTTSTSTVVQY